MDQEQVWDIVASGWKKLKTAPIEEAVNFLRGKKGKALDLACGSGRNFTKINGIIYAVDFSEKMLKHAEKYAKEEDIKVITKKARAERLPFQDNFFDSAIYIASLHCIEGKENRKKSLQELYRVLKSKATALITVWDKDQPRFRKSKKDIMLAWRIGEKKYMRYYYLYDKEEFIALLKEVGFKIVKVVDKDTPQGFYSKRNILAYLQKP
jgi:ubiquinone/menaquinone biosynthesis C-methylase UbiE